MALCRQMIDTAGPVAFACSLEYGHEGPHMASENARSVRERQAWEAQKQSAQKLSQFQGKPETTAERYTDGATPPPSPGQTPASFPICESCWSGNHMECVQRAGVIAVAYHGHSKVEKYCECFERSPRDHGIDMEQLGQSTKQSVDDDQIPPEVEDGEAESVQDRLMSKIREAYNRGLIIGGVEDVEQMIEAIQRSKGRYGTSLHAFNDRDILQDIIEELMDLLVYLSSMQDARDATRSKIIERVARELERWIASNPDTNPTVETVAGIAVDTIFNAMGGPVLE